MLAISHPGVEAKAYSLIQVQQEMFLTDFLKALTTMTEIPQDHYNHYAPTRYGQPKQGSSSFILGFVSIQAFVRSTLRILLSTAVGCIDESGEAC